MEYFNIVFLIVWIVAASRNLFLVKRKGILTYLNIAASVCLIIGAIGFFGNSFSRLYPLDKEWPMGTKNIAIKMNDDYIVADEFNGRIQVYNKGFDFKHAWLVNNAGGALKLLIQDDSIISIYTARGNNRFEYDITGRLLYKSSYQSGEYSKIPENYISLNIPTPLYLLILTKPFIAFGFAAIGMIVLFFVRSKTDSKFQSLFKRNNLNR